MNYILQIEILGMEIGTLATPVKGEPYSEMPSTYVCGDMYILKEIVENNPEWFKPEEERIELTRSGFDKLTGLHKRDAGEFTTEEKELMEAALNGELVTKEANREDNISFATWVTVKFDRPFKDDIVGGYEEWLASDRS